MAVTFASEQQAPGLHLSISACQDGYRAEWLKTEKLGNKMHAVLQRVTEASNCQFRFSGFEVLLASGYEDWSVFFFSISFYSPLNLVFTKGDW